jgi:catechol-2,3-dioxygenase
MATNGVTTKVKSPEKLAHVVLNTSPENYKAMTSFYKTFLGGHAAMENDQICFITYDEEHHRIAIIAIPGLEPKVSKSSPGLGHIAFAHDSLPSLFEAYKQRLTNGLKPIWCVNHGMTMSMYYKDPDGNHLETQVDIMDVDKANAYMYSAEFTENPIGVDYVPEELMARLEKGESVESLTKRPNIGKRGLDTVPLAA